MKVVILAGGLGTRLSEETEVKPKPMVDVGGHPLLWHIMRGFAHHGYTEFVVALGYKGESIKRWLVDHVALAGSMTVDLKSQKIERHARELESWKVHLVETGHQSNTGGRLRRLKAVLGDEPFMVTYGDGVADVDIPSLVRTHREQGRLATLTAVRPPARFGGVSFDGQLIDSFTEKPQAGEGWINGGFMVMQPAVLDRISADDTSLEAEILEGLAAERQLAAHRHEGFWQCMDTLRDKRFLESLWQEDRAPWKVWK